MAITLQADQIVASMMPDQEFQEFLSQGRFMLQRSASSGRFVFPPRVAEPGTGVRDLEWVEADGRGTVYSITFVSQRSPALPYNVCLVDLVEGPRVLSRIEGVAPEKANIGMAVHAKILDSDTGKLLVFVPDEVDAPTHGGNPI